jgi:peptidoglycan/xylan/chitin deacetylase (PgdA/CDA1 family)
LCAASSFYASQPATGGTERNVGIGGRKKWLARKCHMRMKRFALQMMRSCGLFAVTRAMTANRARILMYHNFSGLCETGDDAISTTMLRRQFEYLRRRYRVVPLAFLLDRLRSHQPLDNHLVALTVDDGRRNCYEFFFPLLKEFGMSATFFVVSSFISREDWLWTDKVLWLGEQPSAPPELAPHRVDLFFQKLNLMRPEVRNARIAAVAQSMNLSIPKEAPSKYAPCSWSELREMVDSELVEIGSHTVSHPILSSITGEESWYELVASRTQIEAGSGAPVMSFCFPNGKPEDYRQSQVHQVKEAGYLSALVTRPGMIGPGSDFYQLPRIGVSGRFDPLVFAKHLDGAEYYQERLQTSFGQRVQTRSDIEL